MFRFLNLIGVGLLRLGLGVLCLSAPAARSELWCTGYYPGWEQSAAPPSGMDFTTLTHVVHFALLPNTDGTINSGANSLTVANSSNLLAQAHTAGRKVLVCVGGADSQLGFQGATSASNRTNFIVNLVNFMSARGYDGVDVDWEPLEASDALQFTNFISGLRTALNAVNPRPLLTAAMAVPPTPPVLIASVQQYFDQINLMTYDMSGPYDGWVTWFNSPIYDGGYRFNSTGQLVPSVDGMVGGVTNAGVPSSKIGIGIAFYGWVWSGGLGTTTGGASLPRQSWTTAPTTTQLSHRSILATLFQTNLYHWDPSAQAAYLSLNTNGSANDKFVSYDDERTCQSKISYARNHHLGGVFIWELAQDHTGNEPAPLMKAIKQAFATPGSAAIRLDGTNVDLSFNSAALGTYRALWTSNLSNNAWNTLLVTNEPGTGGVLHVTDPLPLEQTQRFYRIKTPQ